LAAGGLFRHWVLHLPGGLFRIPRSLEGRPIDDDARATFSRRLHATRTALGLSQAVLGQLVSMTQANISQFESGRRSPNLTNLRKIAVALNVSTDYLVGIKETS
jgi:DNA-binding XRE family transcriptional regulator